MQQTDFPYEVLVYDDASTDGTPAIIREYVAKYPHIFKPTLYEENNYSQGLGYVGLYTGIKEATGKYVAYCEGDDYWTDPKKLQKQVDFLEAHPDYEICAHEVIVKYADGREILYSDFEHNIIVSVKQSNYDFSDILTGNIIHISSMMYRNFDIKMPWWLYKISACDMVWFRLLGEKGKLHLLSDTMSVYRNHMDSLTNSNTEYNSLTNYYCMVSIPVLRLLNRFWNRKYQEKVYSVIAKYYAESAWTYLRKSYRDIVQLKKMLRMAMLYDSCSACWHLTKRVINRIFFRNDN